MAERSVTSETGEVVEHSRRYFDGPDYQGLELGRLTRGNLTRVEELVIDNSKIASNVPEAKWTELGYHLAVDGHGWYRNTLRLGRGKWGEATSIMDPLGHTHRLIHDPHALHVIEVVDPLGLSRKALID